MEHAALLSRATLSVSDLARMFFPGQAFDDAAELNEASPSGKLHDALRLAAARSITCGGSYPFEVTERTIRAGTTGTFNLYTFLLLGRTLNFGGPINKAELLAEFRSFFEDAVCWALRKAGFSAEVLSEAREPRGLPTPLADALTEIAARFRECAVLDLPKLQPHDNDLDVDVLAVPLPGSTTRGGWPLILIQCATGAVSTLQSKIGEGRLTFCGVWIEGFHSGSMIRSGATPYDLLALSPVHWNRLSAEGWVLDRTRIAYLGAGRRHVPVPSLLRDFWRILWGVRREIDWSLGWQGA
jgi:hypothetical protein